MTATVRIRFTERDRKKLEIAANWEKEGLSEWCREALLRAASRVKPTRPAA